MNLKEILRQYWGYSSFRPLQEEIIQSVMQGKDTLALLPTGGGKSICFQVPGMARDGMCLVISPLIALMKDQVQNLRKRGIPAFAIYSGLRWSEMELIYNHCGHDQVKFLYVSPERLESKDFLVRLKQWKINLIAVDEAHCISQWGYDFRPPYLRIATIRQYLKGIPVLALTATAVPLVVEDIQKRLNFPEFNTFQQSFHRDNLAYLVLKEEDKKGRLLRIINKTKGTGILYVRNRKKTAEIAQFLVKNGISATFYHAGLDAEARSKRQDEWMSGKKQVIVATNAFGMGIDKPDVRFVVHLDLPESLEAYFQEAGRAGRDGKNSYSVILFDDTDITNLKSNFSLSWPEPDKIRNIYLALSNFARIPMGCGKDTAVDFDITAFSRQYKFNPVTVFKVLSFLEKQGYLLLNDDINLSSQLHIRSGRDDLYRVQLRYAHLDELIKLMLRSYGGLFADFVPIKETELAERSGLDINILKKYLLLLQELGVVDYIPKPAMPQLIFCQNRIEEKFIDVQGENYLLQKEAANKRLEAVISYVSLLNRCRSSILLSYFGESTFTRCNKCDVCLQSAKNKVSDEIFAVIAGRVKQQLSEGTVNLAEMIKRITEYPETTVVSVINLMIENDLIKIDKNKNLN